METALVLCEGHLGKYIGKTANGLVRYSERFEILGVIDSTKAGQMAHEVVEGASEDIPIFSDIDAAISNLQEHPDYLIIGVATIGGMLPFEFRPVIIEAIKNEIGVIAGLHEFLAEDEELSSLAEQHGVELMDVRREPPLEKMKRFADLCKDLPCLRIPVLGTDSSIGKRTTAIQLMVALNNEGVKTAFVTTGQTGILQGFKYGVPLDSIQGDYMVGELEQAIVKTYTEEKPQVILIEGQGAISHPAYVCGSRAVITASQPSGIILQHAPGREYRNFRQDELKLPMPELEDEIKMIEMFSGSKVIALTLNHENMSQEDIEEKVKEYKRDLDIPCSDVFRHGCEKLVEAIRNVLVD
jgi:uncharacterized NAD-dependent epimerase/dehydratase family protein